MTVLKNYPWPGNVRELENAVERAVVLAKGHYLNKNDFAFLARSAAQDTPFSLKDNEKQHVERILNLYGWNISKAAEALEISRVTLHNKINIIISVQISPEPVAHKIHLHRQSVRQNKMKTPNKWKSRLFDCLSLPTLILKPDKSVVDVNVDFIKKFRTKKKDIIGKKCHDFFYSSADPCPLEDCGLPRF